VLPWIGGPYVAAIVVPNKRSIFPVLWYSPDWELIGRKQANPEGGLVILSLYDETFFK
jgi:hypothetical protein